MSYSWEVMKFGGTSVSCADAFIKCVQIIEQCKSPNVAVVVSAMGKHPVYATKTTDLLLNLLPDAIQGKPVRPMLDLILNRHIETMDEILPKSEVTRLGDSFAKDMCGLEDILRAGE
jgi:aspartokinase